jgi:HD-GYP domain-containing protein (c-di-GMP phosphodiesterase class II)
VSRSSSAGSPPPAGGRPPGAILLKPGPLTPEEYEVVKEHAELGARITEEVLRPEQVDWIRTHHERPDGRGYPRGMREEYISEGATLLAVADAWDVMTRSRSYSVPKDEAEARAECRALVGAQFTAQAVEALEAALSTPASTVSVSA